MATVKLGVYKGRVVISSNTLAKCLEKRHGNILETIDSVIAKVEMDNLFFQVRLRNNKRARTFYITREGLSLLVNNSEDGEALKLKLSCLKLMEEKEAKLKKLNAHTVELKEQVLKYSLKNIFHSEEEIEKGFSVLVKRINDEIFSTNEIEEIELRNKCYTVIKEFLQTHIENTEDEAIILNTMNRINELQELIISNMTLVISLQNKVPNKEEVIDDVVIEDL